MKRFIVFLFVVANLVAQDDESKKGFDFKGPGDGAGFSQLMMPLGVSNIDGKNYISLRIQPELAFGKFGVGLDIPLVFSASSGALRTDEYKGGIGALRVVRYIRYGKKHEDPFYARVGDLAGSQLGYGLIMYNYNNAVSFEKRKIGANIDVNYDQKIGMEVVYSDFQKYSVLGLRPYTRPLKETGIPIIKTTEFGVSYVSDHDKDVTYQGATAMGADVGMTVLQNSFIQIIPYMEFATISENDDLKKGLKAGTVQHAEDTAHFANTTKYKSGQGFAIGTNFKINFVADVFNLGIKLERRIYSDHFTPQYFDGIYEIDKDRKAVSLVTAKGVQGNYGEIFANLLNKVNVLGGISIPDKLKSSNGAYIHLAMSAPDLIPKVTISGTYDKGYLTDLGDAFKMDSRSVSHMLLGYEVYQVGPFVMQAGVDYKWTYFEDKKGKLKANKYITPFVGMTTKLPFGDQKK